MLELVKQLMLLDKRVNQRLLLVGHQSTPVLLNYGERAELENTDEWISLSSSLEGVVILKRIQNIWKLDS